MMFNFELKSKQCPRRPVSLDYSMFETGVPTDWLTTIRRKVMKDLGRQYEAVIVHDATFKKGASYTNFLVGELIALFQRYTTILHLSLVYIKMNMLLLMS